MIFVYVLSFIFFCVDLLYAFYFSKASYLIISVFSIIVISLLSVSLFKKKTKPTFSWCCFAFALLLLLLWVPGLYLLRPVQNNETVSSNEESFSSVLFNRQENHIEPFVIYLAGEDSRSGVLSTKGRTDVNLLVGVNPNIKQLLVIGIPRDYYIPNPAISYKNDKLTHLGNAGIENTIKGVSEYFDIAINYYAVVNFDSFKDIIDAIGGVDVENPYYFSTDKGNGGQFSGGDFEFNEGLIHLDGNAALAYCRERYNLEKGDFDRSEHQTIIIKALAKKLLSLQSAVKFMDIYKKIEKSVLTDIDKDVIFRCIERTINDSEGWDIVSYRLDGKGDMQGTASIGESRKLYVVWPDEKWVKFVYEQFRLLMLN